MKVHAEAESHKKNFDHYMDKVDAAEVDGDVAAMKRNLERAIDYWFKYTESADSPTIKANRLESLDKLVRLLETLPDEGPMPEKGAKRGPSKAVEGGDEEKTKFAAVERPSLRFGDIAGLEDVKEEVRMKMLYPFRHPEQAERFRIKRGGGVLLWGPPGTGKTMMARAIAGEIEAAFFTVKPSDIMSKWVGDSEQNIRALFDEARSHATSIIFIDEIEAVIPARRGNETGGVMTRLVPQILAELEGFDTADKNPLLFIGATNEPWSLDPAVLRPGRFDTKIYVGLPDLPARERLLEIGMKGRPCDDKVDLKELAKALEGYSGADIANMCGDAAERAFKRAVQEGEADAVITSEDLARVFMAAKPSVSADNLKRFEDYRKRN